MGLDEGYLSHAFIREERSQTHLVFAFRIMKFFLSIFIKFSIKKTNKKKKNISRFLY